MTNDIKALIEQALPNGWGQFDFDKDLKEAVCVSLGLVSHAPIEMREKDAIITLISTLRQLSEERDRLLKGEFICHECGLRKTADAPKNIEF